MIGNLDSEVYLAYTQEMMSHMVVLIITRSSISSSKSSALLNGQAMIGTSSGVSNPERALWAIVDRLAASLTITTHLAKNQEAMAHLAPKVGARQRCAHKAANAETRA